MQVKFLKNRRRKVVTLIFKEGKNKELVNLTSVTEKMMKICLETLSKEKSNWKS